MNLEVIVAQPLLKANEELAKQNRNLLNRGGITTVNLISAPGAGKTTLLEKTIGALKNVFSIGIVEGDIYTTFDSERLAGQGVAVVQINTYGGCHLDAQMVAQALERLPLDKLKLLFIENVGNLVCPAEFDLGENCKVAILSVSEGSDKPKKYPLVFQLAEVVILNKIDLLPYTDFDLAAAKEQLKEIKNNLVIFPLSAKTGEGMEAWVEWLRDKVSQAEKLSATG